MITLPVSVEQLAAAIRHMSPADRRRLLDLVPELRQAATQLPPRTLDEARAAVERVRAEVVQACAGPGVPPQGLFAGALIVFAMEVGAGAEVVEAVSSQTPRCLAAF